MRVAREHEGTLRALEALFNVVGTPGRTLSVEKGYRICRLLTGRGVSESTNGIAGCAKPCQRGQEAKSGGVEMVLSRSLPGENV